MRKLFFIGSLALIFTFNSQAQKKRTIPGDVRIGNSIKKMTLKEKIAMVHANGLFSSAGVRRLGIPDLLSDDGPLGVREEVNPGWGSANLSTDSATFFQNGSAIAATWNPELAYRYGHDIGEEARARVKYILLSPAFNIGRTPLNGRTYEYYSEDPFLNARLAVSAVKGIQSQHVAACVKHYAANNQEVERSNVDVELDERTLREIYLPAFKACITEANAWVIMSAYNKVFGEYCSENDYLLNTILKKEWKFPGVVMSDWAGTHSTVNAANNGLVIEMGSGEKYDEYFFDDKLLKAVKSGEVSMRVLEEKVRRILWVMHQTSLSGDHSVGSINTPEHSKTAYDIAAESIVLLKNEGQLLPLDLTTLKSIAVIGDNATHTFHLGGYGAGVKARYEVTALAGLKDCLGNKVTINFAQGYIAREQVGENSDIQNEGKLMIDEAVAAAKRSDIAILFIGGNRDYESESRDRKDLSLPFGEQRLVDAVSAANANTIVVFVWGVPYDISTIKKNNHTIVWSWYNGAENGNAMADVLTGKVNPSGKLPFTFPASLKDSPAHANGPDAYPGVNLVVSYKEGILVGYRWFDTKKIVPLYPFGFGLSFTTFHYDSLRANRKRYTISENIIISLNVKNTDKYAGKETVQLYVSKRGSAVDRADKELKAFKKVWTAAGTSADFRFAIPVRSLAYFDVKKEKWVVEPGVYLLKAGTSSGVILQETIITIL